MHDRCRACGLLFEREQGYFVGAIYVNYAVTVALVMVGSLVLERYVTLDVTTQIVIWSAFAIAFPVLFFRYSRSLWLSVEYLVNDVASEPRVVR